MYYEAPRYVAWSLLFWNILCTSVSSFRISLRNRAQAKRVVENGFDKSPVHGLGREKSPNWWKSLADQLLCLGTSEGGTLHFVVFSF